MSDFMIAVEGTSDVILLRRLLTCPNGGRFRFFAGQGQMSLASLGRNILFDIGGPLLVVENADTLNASKADEMRGLTRAAIRLVTSDDPFTVFAFLPELEVILFESPDVLLQRFGAETVNPIVIERGHYKPKAALEDVLKTSGVSIKEFFKSLTTEEIEDLRRGDQCRGLTAAFESLMATASS